MLNGLLREGIAQHLAFSVVEGKMTEAEARRQQKLANRSREIELLSNEEWPGLDVVWDLNPEHFHLALDQSTAAAFAEAFPSIEVAGVDIEELHRNLLRGSQRIAPPFDPLYRSKTGRLVAHLEAGGKATPPLVRRVETGVCLAGGNHRFGWARHRSQGKIPILIVVEERLALADRLTTLAPWS